MRVTLKYTLFLTIGTLLLTLASCNEGVDSAPKSNTGRSEAGEALPKLLDLGAHECIPCKKMASILDELTREYQGVFEVEFVDVWQAENKSRAREHGVRSIPTPIFFAADGKELWRHVGFLSKEAILKKWEELGYDFEAAQAAEGHKDIVAGEG
jgi:thioredoxin 1